ncbi:hypothetical protein GGS23DRAFT_570459 [Durotheca rogersii]|uniref:uncharacterized protein n=1 Tax=Durotheca rogersii TaxID=419775 RepID=UPI00221FF275|nr:uncharacterized protein GGS23DRAFT_570459 [Durotheca rogersii]KAI5862488.1 hypothetical protein GGS23DRAFT_570459 [Durotheca rogersii]
MPPRLNCCSAPSSASRALRRAASSRRPMPSLLLQSSKLATSTTTTTTTTISRHYTSTSSAPAAFSSLVLPDDYIPPTRPPSARRPEQRKAQLLRSYTAMLRSTPLILFFQHNNMTAVELAAVRRELRAALAKVPVPEAGPDGDPPPIDIAPAIELQVLRTRIFTVALKIDEFFDPKAAAAAAGPGTYTHDLSEAAYAAIKQADITESTAFAQISPLLIGPIAAVTFPAVSPAHLATVLSVLAPSPAYPPPSRKKSPGYYDLSAQTGFQKLLLVGGRVEGRVFDNEGVMWVGSIKGGVGSLRAQLVSMLQNAGLGLTTVLEGQSKGLWLALESRRTQLEEEANGGAKKEAAAEKPSA